MAEPHQVLNDLGADEAHQALMRCCGSRRWVAAMLALRPFVSTAALHSAAERSWAALGRDDFLEAFGHHPRIGARAAGWAAEEQGGARDADDDTRQALAAANDAYAARFGFIFIVCATGKSAGEMLALLRARLDHDPETELRLAAAEQAKITRLRLDRLAAP
jgi:2-oxo-4-hydroxy-4-carboxy-5-ureidoimidazoline decarboxylase